MVCGWIYYAFLIFLLLVIQPSPTMSLPEFCQDPFVEEKDAWLCFHNIESATVQPTAGNMNLYSWDPELHRLAIKLAERCTRGTFVPVNSYNNSIGINTAMTEIQPTVENKGLDAVVMGWANEKDYYNFERNTCAYRRTCYHYTQVVWARTKYLGCAISSKPCRNGKFVSVCLYAPKGNIAGERPYLSSPACSQCEPDRRSCIVNLCAP